MNKYMPYVGTGLVLMANAINDVNNHLWYFFMIKCHCWSVLFERNLGIRFLYLLSYQGKQRRVMGF